VHAADTFVPLATWLTTPIPVPPPIPASPPPPDVPPSHPERRFAQRTDVEGGRPTSPIAAAAAPPDPPPQPAMREALRDVRLFRARLAEALDVATATLVRDLAYAVLGRELHLAPADLAALAARILAEHPAAEPVAIRHAPGDAPPPGIPAVADPGLALGDCVILFAGGDVDARLGVRLAVALEAWS
jgi:hypothetical protein